MKFLKALFVGILSFTLVACATNQESEAITVMTPMGATALSMLGLYDDEKVTIDTVDGSDALSAQLHKKDGYDVIVAPINLGAKLISTGKTEYVLHSIVTWGNLYIVGTDEAALTQEGNFAAFGEGAVPQKVLTSAFDMENMVPTITYYNSVNDVQAQLLTGKAKIGMLAEPAATATIAKAKEKNIELKVLKDLQKEYSGKLNLESEGYPQAAVFVRKDSLEKSEAYLEKAATFVNETAVKKEEAINTAVEAATTEKLGVPSSEIAVKTWKRQNIHFVKANTVKKDIDTYLEQFKITLDSAYYAK